MVSACFENTNTVRARVVIHCGVSLRQSVQFYCIPTPAHCTYAIMIVFYRGIRDLPLPPTASDDLLIEEVESAANEKNDVAKAATRPVFHKRPKILARSGILEKNKHAWG